MGNDLSYYLMVVPAALLSIMIHEVSHGYAAYILGDPTAKNHGRLTLNPIQHIDILGLICLVFVGFGWAKPVPINVANFKNRKVGLAISSLAGPLSNFLLSFVCVVIVFALSTFAPQSSVALGFANFLMITALISAGLGVFNLIPVPPLDGSNIIVPFLPQKIRAFIYNNQQYIQFGLVVLLIFNVLDVFIINMRTGVMSFITMICNGIFSLFI